MLQLNPQVGLYLYGALSTCWKWSIIWIKCAFMCTEKVVEGLKWSFPSFLTAVDKFLYTLLNMPYAVSSSAGSLIYSKVYVAARWMGGTCQALTCPQVWALCIEPCGANITSILGILFTHQSTAIICVIMPNHVYTMFHHTVIYQTTTITPHKVSQVLPSLYFTLTNLTDS